MMKIINVYYLACFLFFSLFSYGQDLTSLIGGGADSAESGEESLDLSDYEVRDTGDYNTVDLILKDEAKKWTDKVDSKTGRVATTALATTSSMVSAAIGTSIWVSCTLGAAKIPSIWIFSGASISTLVGSVVGFATYKKSVDKFLKLRRDLCVSDGGVRLLDSICTQEKEKAREIYAEQVSVQKKYVEYIKMRSLLSKISSGAFIIASVASFVESIAQKIPQFQGKFTLICNEAQRKDKKDKKKVNNSEKEEVVDITASLSSLFLNIFETFLETVYAEELVSGGSYSAGDLGRMAENMPELLGFSAGAVGGGGAAAAASKSIDGANLFGKNKYNSAFEHKIFNAIKNPAPRGGIFLVIAAINSAASVLLHAAEAQAKRDLEKYEKLLQTIEIVMGQDPNSISTEGNSPFVYQTPAVSWSDPNSNINEESACLDENFKVDSDCKCRAKDKCGKVTLRTSPVNLKDINYPTGTFNTMNSYPDIANKFSSGDITGGIASGNAYVSNALSNRKRLSGNLDKIIKKINEINQENGEGRSFRERISEGNNALKSSIQKDFSSGIFKMKSGGDAPSLDHASKTDPKKSADDKSSNASTKTIGGDASATTGGGGGAAAGEDGLDFGAFDGFDEESSILPEEDKNKIGDDYVAERKEDKEKRAKEKYVRVNKKDISIHFEGEKKKLWRHIENVHIPLAYGRDGKGGILRRIKDHLNQKRLINKKIKKNL